MSDSHIEPDCPVYVKGDAVDHGEDVDKVVVDEINDEADFAQRLEGLPG